MWHMQQNIRKENAQFLRDRQFFDHSYFDFMRDLFTTLKFEPVFAYPTFFNTNQSNDEVNTILYYPVSKENSFLSLLLCLVVFSVSQHNVHCIHNLFDYSLSLSRFNFLWSVERE
jgi:hypothetical protein